MPSGLPDVMECRCVRRAFTLLELMVAMVISVLIMAVLVSVMTQASTLWIASSAKIEAFQDARTAFDLITRDLSQATLNTYMGYDNPNAPTRYLRSSDLKFYSGNAGVNGTPGLANTGQGVFFVAPVSYTSSSNISSYGGMEALLNVVGYYVSFTQNSAVPSYVPTSANPYRYRLMQMLVPTETANCVYLSSGNTWFTGATPLSSVTPAADNIIALIIRPQDVTTNPVTDLTYNTYTYDSTANASANPQPITANQLPPVVQVTMVAIDERSARQMDNGSTQPSLISTALSGKFVLPANYTTDLSSLETALDSARPKIQYRVFSAAVGIQETKWTK